MRNTLLSLGLLIAAGLFLLWAFVSTPTAVLEVPTPLPTTPIEPKATAVVLGDCSAEMPVPGGHLVEGVVGAPIYSNPILADPNPIDRMLTDLIFDGLVRMDARGLPQPALAESWEISEDGRTLQFRLRADARWHDGQPVNAADVVYTYGLLANAEIGNGVSELWQTVQINRLDDVTVEFVLAEPYAPFLEAVSRGLLPAHLLQGLSAADLRVNAFNNQPVGSGPFVAANDWVSDGFLRLTPNVDYWPSTDLEGLELRFFASDVALADAYLQEEIDAVGLISAETFPTIAELPDIRLFSSAENQTTQLFYNTETGAMADQRLRKAIAHTINRDALIAQAIHGQGVPFNGPFAPQSWAANPDFPLFETNVVTASTLLDSANWLLVDDNPIRQLTKNAGGEDETIEPLQLRLLTVASQRHVDTANVLAEQLFQSGISVLIESEPLAAYQSRLTIRDFDIALVDVLAPADPDLYSFWSQEAIVRGQNFAGWNNRRASEALEVARQRYEPEERFDYYAGFNRAFADELPALGLYQAVHSYGLRNTVVAAGTGREVVIGRIAAPRDRYATLSDWRVNSAEVPVACD